VGNSLLRFAALCALLTACAAPTPPGPVPLRIEATDLTAPLLSDLAAAYSEANPAVVVAPTVLPLSIAAADVAAARADLALVASPDPEQFATPVGYVSFIVVVHPSNLIFSLSAAQVQEIFAGGVTDWGQFGGPNGEIQVVGREDASDAARAFGMSALSGAFPTPNALVAPSWPAMREAVGENPNALGYLPVPELDATVKQVSVDADWRALIVAVAMNEPTGPARDFLAWVQSAAGQEVVAKRYERVK